MKLQEAIDLVEIIEPSIIPIIEAKAAYISDFRNQKGERDFYFRMFCDAFREFDFSSYINNWYKFSTMSPCAGPWACNTSDYEGQFKIHGIMSSAAKVTICDEYVGTTNFLTNYCGIDNLIILAGFSSKFCRLKGAPQYTFNGSLLDDVEKFSHIKDEFYGVNTCENFTT